MTLTGKRPLPNVIAIMVDLLENTTPSVSLTRHTLLTIIKRLNNQKSVLSNPHEFATVAVQIIKNKLADHLVNGIQYEKFVGLF